MARTTVFRAGCKRAFAACLSVVLLVLVAGCGGGSDSDAQTSPEARQTARAASLGERVFAEHCLSCHGMTGRASTGTTGEYGPSFDHVRIRSRPYVEYRLEYGGIGMQSFTGELTEAERDAVVRYVLTRSGSRVADERLTRYERVAGARLFRENCSTCHAIAGRAATGSPTYPGTDFGVVRPSYDLTQERTIHGYYWWMPDFRQFEEREVKAVARWVQKMSGGHEFRSPFE